MSQFEEKVAEQIIRRAEHGLKKYGVGVDRTDLTPAEWIQHAKEEGMDLAVYLERLQAEGQLMPERLWKLILAAIAERDLKAIVRAFEVAEAAGFRAPINHPDECDHYLATK